MCGISGYLNLTSGVRTNVLRRMNDVIRHRGPDDEGYALIGPSGCSVYGGPDSDKSLTLEPLEHADGSHAFLGLGHRRLSILDLSPSGHQPMRLPERELTVVYNGEIYNYVELRQELTDLGYVFHTSCDTEILLKAYCQWGEDCLEHFNGMWSFALWDGKEHKLFCARDRLGAKPFHYYYKNGIFLFGSELKQLCQDDQISRRFNLNYLAANLVHHISDFDDQTLIQDMKALAPGHCLTLRVSADWTQVENFSIRQYWNLNTEYLEGLSAEEWKRRVAEEFSRSCRWRLRSDAPVAALLSGGLDSSCLVTELCGQMSDPASLQTFTTSYPGRADCDEWDFAKMVIDACGCTGHQILPDPTQNIEHRFEELIWHIEGIGGLSLLGPKILLDDINQRGIKVVLNGQCGDETMFGYERYYAFYFADLLKQGKVATALREFQLAAQHSRFSLSLLFQMLVYFNVAPVQDTRQLKRAAAFVSPEVLAQRDKKQMHQLLYSSSLKDLQKKELTATQLTHIVRFDDRLYMSASIESRIPFMDYRFVELAARIPPAMKIQNGYTKNIMREIFDDRMPKNVTWRINKMGFGAPVDQWARAFSRDYLLDQIQNAKAAAYFRTDRLEEIVCQNAAAPAIFEFLQIEQFARQFGVD